MGNPSISTFAIVTLGALLVLLLVMLGHNGSKMSKALNEERQKRWDLKSMLKTYFRLVGEVQKVGIQLVTATFDLSSNKPFIESTAIRDSRLHVSISCVWIEEKFQILIRISMPFQSGNVSGVQAMYYALAQLTQQCHSCCERAYDEIQFSELTSNAPKIAGEVNKAVTFYENGLKVIRMKEELVNSAASEVVATESALAQRKKIVDKIISDTMASLVPPTPGSSSVAA